MHFPLTQENLSLFPLLLLKKQPESELKIQLNGKKICGAVSVKYLGIQIDKDLKKC